MTTVISFSSQKGGVGKTTSAINLSTALALGGYRVLMIDLDPQDSMRASLGITDPISGGTLELFRNSEISLAEICTPTSHENLEFIFSNISLITDEQEIVQTASDQSYLKNWLNREVGEEHDFVVIDAPPSMGSLSINALVASDLIVIPLQCEALAVKSLKRFLRIFKQLQSTIDEQLRIAGILLTMYDRSIKSHRMVSRQIYQGLQNAVFKTIIPKCDTILEASISGQSVISKSLPSIGATAYIRLANEILDRYKLR
ncbi:MAG: ParA family protein [SAR324 cluster bacterium]|nr:ParA family protein [SAR324 cluster bacterium]